MGSPGREHPATLALRTGSLADLRDALSADLARNAGAPDDRDVMIHLTPYWEAAGRLGSLPAVVFDEAAATVDGPIGDLARRFGRRTDLTLGVMGWRLEETPDGPAYRFAWPRWTPGAVARRAAGGSASPGGEGA